MAQTAKIADGRFQPTVPPVSGLKDSSGALIGIGNEVIVNRLFMMRGRLGSGHCYRASVVGIGDPGLPGRAVVKIRPYCSTYIETAGPDSLTVHTFEPYAWINAETEAALEASRLGWELVACLFGGFRFEQFQRLAATFYMRTIAAEAVSA